MKSTGAISAKMIDHALPNDWRVLTAVPNWDVADMIRVGVRTTQPESEVKLEYATGVFYVMVKNHV